MPDSLKKSNESRKEIHLDSELKQKVIDLISSNVLLLKHYARNSPEIKSKVIEHLMEPPSLSDCPGFVYGFK